MTQGNVIGEEFKPYVFDQINIRQSLNGAGGAGNPLSRNPQILNFLNTRNTWVKMASGVALTDKIKDKNLPEGSRGVDRLKSISKDLLSSNGDLDFAKYNSTGLAKNFVLFNTLSNFNFKNETNQEFSNYTFRSGIQKSQQNWLDVDSSYGLGGTAMGLQPTPGIIDVSIDCVNRGSIRKATVTLKAFNTFQFSLIEMLYLRLGYTMMLEWGWDKYVDKIEADGRFTTQNMENTLIEDFWFKNQDESNLIKNSTIISRIEETRDKYQGNYDGFFGKVNNFTWNFNPDGSYDITINLITVGDVIESLKVNSSAPVTTQKELDNFKKSLENEKNFSDEALSLISMGDDIISRELNNLIIKHTGENNSKNPLISYKNIKGLEESGKYGGKDTLPPGELNYFMRLGLFLDKLKEIVIPRSNGESIIDIETDSETNFVKSYYNQIPFDPKVCLFTIKWGKNFLGSYPRFKQNDPFKEINEGLPEKFVIEKDGFTVGKLMNVYLNVDFLLKTIKNNVDEKGDLSLYKLVESICNGLNNALGGFNNLEPVIKEDKTLVIIDQNPIPQIGKFLKKKTPSNVPFLEVYGYNKGKSNFLKDIKFQTKIDNSLASMISIGATAGGSDTKNSDATAFSKWNLGLRDRFSSPIKDPKPILSPENTTALGKDLIEYRKNAREYALRETKDFGGGKWRLPYSSTYPTTSGRSIIGYKSILGDIEDVADFFVKDSEKAIIERDIQTYKENEIIRNTQNTYAGYLHDIFAADFPYSFSDGTPKTDINIVKKYNKLFTNNLLVERGKTTFKAFINTLSQAHYTETQTPSGNIGFIPVSFDLTLEGLSGVKIYNKLNIDTRFLPPNYGESLDFLITKVNHKISDNNWDTILGTISTSNIKEDISTSDILLTSGDLDKIIATDFSSPTRGTTREILGTTYTNGEIPDDKLRPINNPSKYKGSIQSDGGRIRLFTEASIALDKLLEKAENDGIIFRINSAYRTFNDQVRVKKAYGDTAATPGTSNHGFGLAVDFSTPNFARISPQDPQYKWLIQNGADFGFKRLNFAGKKDGEAWESWHWEYQIGTLSDTEATVLGIISSTSIGRAALNLFN